MEHHCDAKNKKEESRDDDALPVKLATEQLNSDVLVAARTHDLTQVRSLLTHQSPQSLTRDLNYAMLCQQRERWKGQSDDELHPPATMVKQRAGEIGMTKAASTFTCKLD
jgi:hypothetical protein